MIALKCLFKGHLPGSPFPDRDWAFQLSFSGKKVVVTNVYLCKRCGVLFTKKEPL